MNTPQDWPAPQTRVMQRDGKVEFIGNLVNGNATITHTSPGMQITTSGITFDPKQPYTFTVEPQVHEGPIVLPYSQQVSLELQLAEANLLITQLHEQLRNARKIIDDLSDAINSQQPPSIIRGIGAGTEQLSDDEAAEHHKVLRQIAAEVWPSSEVEFKKFWDQDFGQFRWSMLVTPGFQDEAKQHDAEERFFDRVITHGWRRAIEHIILIQGTENVG